MSNKSHILIASMPKSGSTFLRNVIGNLPEFKKYCLVPGFGGREQDIEESRILSYKQINTEYFVSLQHVRRSDVLDEICSRHKIFRVVLCRNLRDVVFSLKDHIAAVGPHRFLARMHADYHTWEEHKKEEYIVDLMMPWYLNFFIGWMRCEDDYTKLIWYEDLMPDKVETISSILKAAGHLDVTIENIIEAIDKKPEKINLITSHRFNKGVSGRGRDLSEKASERLLNLLSYYDLDNSTLKLLF